MATGSVTDTNLTHSADRAEVANHRLDLPLWALLALALLLRVAGSWRSLNLDEICSMEYSGQPLSGIFSYIVAHDTHPPLYYTLLHLWRYAGESEVWVRLPSVLLGVGVCYLSYLIAVQFMPRRMALLTLFLTATAPSLILVSQLARNYTLMSFFAGLSTYFLILLISRPRPAYWVGYVLAAAAGIYSFYLGAYLLLAHNAAFAMSLPRGWRTIRNWLLAQAAVLLLFLPWVPSFLAQADAVKVDSALHHDVSARTIVWLWSSVAAAVEPLSVVNLLTVHGFGVIEKLVVVALSAAAGLAFVRMFVVRYLKLRDCGGGYYLGFIILSTIIFAVVGIAVVLKITRNVFAYAHYFTFLSTFGCVLSAMLLSRLRLRAAWAVVGLILLLQLARYGNVYAVQEDWRGASRALDGSLHSDSCLVTVSYHSAPCIRYYSRGDYEPYGLPFDIPGIGRKPVPHDFVQAIEPADMAVIGRELSKHESVHILWSHVRRGPTDRGEKLMKDWFRDNGYQVAHSRAYPGIVVDRYDR